MPRTVCASYAYATPHIEDLSSVYPCIVSRTSPFLHQFPALPVLPADEPGRLGHVSRLELHGVPLELRLYTNAGNYVREAMADLIREQLAQVGIEVEVVLLDWYTFRDVVFGQTFDMVLFGVSDMGTDPDDLRFWGAESDAPADGGYNLSSYYNPELEGWLRQAHAVPGCDLDQRAALYRRAQATLIEDAPYVWIDVPRTVVALQSRLGGVNPGPWSLWYNVHEWYLIE